MPLLAEVFGASGDALDIGLVVTLITVAALVIGKFHAIERKIDDKLREHEREDHRLFAAQATRLALLEQQRGVDTKRSGAYTVLEHDDDGRSPHR